MKIAITQFFRPFGFSAAGIRRLRELGHEKALDCKLEYSIGDVKLPDEEIAGLSPGMLALCERSEPGWYPIETERTDPRVIQVIEELGDQASGRGCRLKVVEIPDGVDWTIEDEAHDECVVEKHRVWR